jgi:hypothetical protein
VTKLSISAAQPLLLPARSKLHGFSYCSGTTVTYRACWRWFGLLQR